MASLVKLPDDKPLEDFYPQDYYGRGVTKFSSVLNSLINFSVQFRSSLVRRRLKSASGKVLDIGCGSGAFLESMRKSGYEIYGTELDGVAYQRASQVSRIHLQQGNLSHEMFGDARFDAVTIWHVLEHIEDPRSTISTVRELMHPEGLLFIEVPNLDSLQARMFGKHWFHLDPPRHIYQFTDKSLTQMLEAEGFTVVDKGTLSWQMGGIGFLQSALNALLRPRDLFYDMLCSRNRCPGGFFPKLGSVVFGALIFPFAALATPLEAVLGKGSVLRFTCKIKE